MASLFKHNFHTHTSFCDGSSKPEKYVESALDAGLRSVGFSGHAPIPLENGFAIKNFDELDRYCNDIMELKKRYEGRINISLALEVDYIPGISTDFSYFREEYGLEYIIGSIHLVINDEGKLWFIDGPERETWLNGLLKDYGRDVRKAVTAYYHQVSRMVESQKPDIIGHLDKVKMHNRNEFFSEDEKWYISLIRESLQVIKENGSIIEVNTRGMYTKRCTCLFPDLPVLKEMKQLNIPVTISSDAHKPDEITALLDIAAQKVREAGYSEVMVYENGRWESQSLPAGL